MQTNRIAISLFILATILKCREFYLQVVHGIIARVVLSSIQNENDIAQTVTKTQKEAKENMQKDKSTAGECIKCGACENICPQGITIKQNLEK